MVQLTKVLKADIIYPNKKKFTGKCNFSRYIYQLGANQLILWGGSRLGNFAPSNPYGGWDISRSVMVVTPTACISEQRVIFITTNIKTTINILYVSIKTTYIKTMIKILFVSIIIMLYEYGLKKSVSTLQKRNYAPKKIKTLASLEI